MKKIKKKQVKNVRVEKAPIEFLEGHKKWFIVGIASVIILTAILVIGISWYNEQKAQASYLYANIENPNNLNELVNDYGNTIYGKLALLRQGYMLFEEGKIKEAENSFNLFFSRVNDKSIKPIAKMALVSCLEQEKKFEKEVLSLKDIIDTYPDTYWSQTATKKLELINSLINN